MLKVSPWKGVVRFGKRGKLNPRYVGPFKVLEVIGKVAYKIDLPEELSIVHNTFYVSKLKKCHADKQLAVSLDGLHFDDKLHFVEESVEIMDHEVKWLKRSRIPLVKDYSITLTSFANADHAGCQDTRRSTSGSMQFLVIALCCNNVQHSKSKHIGLRYHFIKKHVQDGVIELYFAYMEYQLADIFTKVLGREIIEFLINKLGMQNFTSETLKQLTDEDDE
nr:putative reverse transcriptase domain-containing protein [Tanacetum cinerariifolium]GEZ88874.1 putative reverse transcriptase domain-containing protein [Tanacetum cinerariifolium]